MTEELKYKVGDKVLVEVYVESVGGRDYPYGLVFSKTGEFISHFSKDELDKVAVKLPPKPKIPQAVMDWYFKYQECRWDVDSYLTESVESGECYSWLFTGNRQLDSERQHALATLIAYGPKAVEVEKEKKYKVKLKATNQWLREEYDFFSFGRSVSKAFTKQELIKAGFGDVFDNPMFEVEEVE